MANVLDESLLNKLGGKFKEDNEKAALKSNDGYPFTAPICQFDANAFGLYDMHGNAATWCSDWFSDEYYENAPSVSEDPTGPTMGTQRRHPRWRLEQRSDRLPQFVARFRRTHLPQLRPRLPRRARKVIRRRARGEMRNGPERHARILGESVARDASPDYARAAIPRRSAAVGRGFAFPPACGRLPPASRRPTRDAPQLMQREHVDRERKRGIERIGAEHAVAFERQWGGLVRTLRNSARRPAANRPANWLPTRQSAVYHGSREETETDAYAQRIARVGRSEVNRVGSAWRPGGVRSDHQTPPGGGVRLSPRGCSSRRTPRICARRSFSAATRPKPASTAR